MTVHVSPVVAHAEHVDELTLDGRQGDRIFLRAGDHRGGAGVFLPLDGLAEHLRRLADEVDAIEASR